MTYFPNRVHLEIEFDAAKLSPREVRCAFITALRDAIAQEAMGGALDLAIADELHRALPDPGEA